MKRGRKSVQKAFGTLKEAIQNSSHAAPSDSLYEVVTLDKKVFCYATSKSNAMRFASYFIGFHARVVPVTDLIDAASDPERQITQSCHSGSTSEIAKQASLSFSDSVAPAWSRDE